MHTDQELTTDEDYSILIGEHIGISSQKGSRPEQQDEICVFSAEHPFNRCTLNQKNILIQATFDGIHDKIKNYQGGAAACFLTAYYDKTTQIFEAYVAHVGDCIAYLAQVDSDGRICELSLINLPHTADPKQNKFEHSRVKPYAKQIRGVWRIGPLAPTRGLGDTAGESFGFSHVVETYLVQRQLPPDHRMILLLATDGLLPVTLEGIIDTINSDHQSGYTPDIIAYHLAKKSTNRSRSDNTTLAVISIDAGHPLGSGLVVDGHGKDGVIIAKTAASQFYHTLEHNTTVHAVSCNDTPLSQPLFGLLKIWVKKRQEHMRYCDAEQELLYDTLESTFEAFLKSEDFLKNTQDLKIIDSFWGIYATAEFIPYQIFIENQWYNFSGYFWQSLWLSQSEEQKQQLLKEAWIKFNQLFIAFENRILDKTLDLRRYQRELKNYIQINYVDIHEHMLGLPQFSLFKIDPPRPFTTLLEKITTLLDWNYLETPSGIILDRLNENNFLIQQEVKFATNWLLEPQNSQFKFFWNTVQYPQTYSEEDRIALKAQLMEALQHPKNSKDTQALENAHATLG